MWLERGRHVLCGHPNTVPHRKQSNNCCGMGRHTLDCHHYSIRIWSSRWHTLKRSNKYEKMRKIPVKKSNRKQNNVCLGLCNNKPVWNRASSAIVRPTLDECQFLISSILCVCVCAKWSYLCFLVCLIAIWRLDVKLIWNFMRVDCFRNIVWSRF